jgi:hypothetical protein
LATKALARAKKHTLPPPTFPLPFSSFVVSRFLPHLRLILKALPHLFPIHPSFPYPTHSSHRISRISRPSVFICKERVFEEEEEKPFLKDLQSLKKSCLSKKKKNSITIEELQKRGASFFQFFVLNIRPFCSSLAPLSLRTKRARAWEEPGIT